MAQKRSPVFCSKITYRYLSKADYVPGAGPFSPQGHNLNKLGRGSLGDATYQISRHKASWFQTRRFFHIFPICLCKTCGPKGGPI